MTVAVIEGVAEAEGAPNLALEYLDDDEGGGGELGESIFLKSDSESRRWWEEWCWWCGYWWSWW